MSKSNNKQDQPRKERTDQRKSREIFRPDLQDKRRPEKRQKNSVNPAEGNSAAEEKKLRCDPKQLELLKKCSEKKDMTEWNQWRAKKPTRPIWLDGAKLVVAELEEASLPCAFLEGAAEYLLFHCYDDNIRIW